MKTNEGRKTERDKVTNKERNKERKEDGWEGSTG
jgi:hypothetical protein